jgi:transcriptional regulator with XRE-family HTH domain
MKSSLTHKRIEKELISVKNYIMANKSKVLGETQRIGLIVRTAREDAELTQKQLAKLIDVNPGHLANVENGLSGISLDLLEKIAKVLHYSLSSLLSLNPRSKSSIDPKVFKRNFRYYREVVGLSLDQITKQTGYNKATIASYSSGRRVPSKIGLRKLAKTLKVEPEQLTKTDTANTSIDQLTAQLEAAKREIKEQQDIILRLLKEKPGKK